VVAVATVTRYNRDMTDLNSSSPPPVSAGGADGDAPDFTRNGKTRPLPFGGQALIIMTVHALLSTLADRSLTVNELIADEPEIEALYNSIDAIVLVVILAAAVGFWFFGWRRAFRRTILIYLVLSILTVLLNCGTLVSTLTQRTSDTEGAFALLWDAVLAWTTNVLTFAICYWFLDQGGPDRRYSGNPGPPDLAFPQQTSSIAGWENWRPGLIDYVFVAFNTSTAFSPTDTVALSPSAKILSTLQAGISLVIIAMLAARVVNTIQ
jgi:hypothetical protein